MSGPSRRVRAPCPRPLPGRAALLAAGALLGALGGCGGGVTEDGWPHVAVRGRVATTSGAPVAGATVTLLPRRDSSAAPPWARTEFRTGRDGRYDGGIPEVQSRFRGCLVLVASPPSGSGLRADTVVRDSLDLLVAEEGGPGIVVDVTLPPAP